MCSNIYIIHTSVMRSMAFENALRVGTASRNNLGRLLFMMISEFLISVSIFSISRSELSMASPQSMIRFDNASLAHSSALDILRQTKRDPSGLSFGLLEGRRGIDTNTIDYLVAKNIL